MTATEILQKLAHEIDRIPDEYLVEVLDVLHYFRLGLESSAQPAPPARRRPSPRLAGQGARLSGDDMAPAIPPEDWGELFRGVQ
jgi:hypothetical protein